MTPNDQVCQRCGRSPHPSELDSQTNKCFPCTQRERLAPPDGFELPKALRSDAQRLGMGVSDLRYWAWQEGADFAAAMIARRAARDRLRDTWLPKLRKIEVQDRRKHPIATGEPVAARERALLAIYRQHIGPAPTIVGVDTISVGTLTPLGMQAAIENWGRFPEDCVVLTPGGADEWRTAYQPPDEADPWFVASHLLIDTSPDPTPAYPGAEPEWEAVEIPPGHDPWILSSGCWIGPLAAGRTTQLWTWDGSVAHYVRDGGFWVS